MIKLLPGLSSHLPVAPPTTQYALLKELCSANTASGVFLPAGRPHADARGAAAQQDAEPRL